MLEKQTENHLGQVYKLFRKAKGFTLKEAAGNDISFTQLSNFENGNTMLTADTFFAVLQNINVNTFEFQNAYNSYLSSRDIMLFSSEITDAYLNKNIAKLKTLLKQVENLIKENPKKKKYILDRVHVEATIAMVKPTYHVPEKDIDYLKNYLFNLKEWGIYDISLLGWCVTTFDVFTLADLTQHMLAPAQMNQKLHYVQQTIIQTVLNVINIFINEKQFTLANNLIHYLDEDKILDYYMYEKFTLIYSKTLLAYEQGDEAALSTMKHCQEILEFCECFNTANMVADEIGKIESKH